MIFSILRGYANGSVGSEYILALPFIIIGLLFSLSLHEYAHGLAAYSQGDHFAKQNGRLTLNPFKHLDPLGTIMLLVAGFGWAKPVPVVPSNFKHGKRSMLLVAFAGVLCNLFLAVFFMNLVYFLTCICNVNFGSGIVLKALYITLYYIISVNITLFIFNLLPVPPLDGYRVMKEIFINYKNQYTFYKMERYSNFFLIGLFLLLNFFNILTPLINSVYGVLGSFFNFIYSAYI